MKKIITIVVVVLAFAGIGMWVIGAYNTLIEKEENVESAWSQVENEYQRRSDFITQLVGVLRGVRDFEQGTLTAVTEARAKATSISIDPSNVTPEQLAAFQNAQGELSQAFSRLMVACERYPELQSIANFREAQSQIEGCQNRCTVARGVFNDKARDFNTTVRRFPGNIIARFFGFERKPYFEAEESAKHNPTVEI